jgi:hypothetical protein
MPKAAQEYVILNTEDQAKARELIGFDVVRLPAFCELGGKKIPIPKEAIFREKDLVHYETLSPEYELIKHLDAFNALTTALENRKYHLTQITLENHGAEMTASFRITDVTIATVLGVSPELTLVNSYNSATSLGLKLGTFHHHFGNSALVPGAKSRWLHLGNSSMRERFQSAFEEAMNQFGLRWVTYQKMGGRMLGERAIAMVVVAIEKGIIPKKMGRQILLAVAQHPEITLWSLYNFFLWPLNHDYEGTPSHRLLILKDIAEAFADGGFDLFKQGGNTGSKKLQPWLEIIKEKKS